MGPAGGVGGLFLHELVVVVGGVGGRDGDDLGGLAGGDKVVAVDEAAGAEVVLEHGVVGEVAEVGVAVGG